MAQTRKSHNNTFNLKEKFTPQSSLEKNLIKAFTSVDNADDASALIRDLMTSQEIEEFANRLEMARLLTKGYSYIEVAKKIGVSTTTVTRVAQWLYNGCGGYKKALEKI